MTELSEDTWIDLTLGEVVIDVTIEEDIGGTVKTTGCCSPIVQEE